MNPTNPKSYFVITYIDNVFAMDRLQGKIGKGENEKIRFYEIGRRIRRKRRK